MSNKKNNLALLVSFAVFTLLLLPLRGGFTDDGFIHIQYARNIILIGEYSFNPGAVSFGTTSPLWVLIQAVLGMIFGSGEVLLETSRVISWVSGFAALACLFFLARELSGDYFTALLSSLVFACDAWFVRWTAMSMETSSAALAMILAGLASIRACDNKRWALFLGFFLGIASLLRPEAYLFFPVYLFSLFLRSGKVDSRCALRVIAIFCALIIPWLLFAKLHIGSFLPNTAAAKSGGMVTDPGVFVKKFSPIVKIIGSTQGLWVLLIFLTLLMNRTRSLLLSEKFRFLLLSIITLPLAYVLLDMQVLSRYLLLITPFIAVFGIIAGNEILARAGLSGKRIRLAIGSLALLMMATSIVFYVAVVLEPSKAFSRGLTHELRDLALYINRNAEKNAVVAAADIGYLAFYSRREVLDLGGLVEPATRRLRKRYTYEEIVAKGLYLTIPEYPRVDFFIDREKSARRFEGAVLQGYKFRSLLVKVVDNLGIRKPGPYYYTLYQLEKIE